MDAAIAGDAIGGLRLQQLCAFLDQHLPAGRTRLAVDRITLPDRPAAAGGHEAPLGVGVDGLDPDFRPVSLQLVRNDPGDGGADVLAHFGADDVHGDHAVAADHIPDRRLEPGGRAGGKRCLSGETQDDPGAGCGDQEIPPGKRFKRAGRL